MPDIIENVMALPDIQKWQNLFKYDFNQAATLLTKEPSDNASFVVNEIGVDFFITSLPRLNTDEAAAFLRNLLEELREKILSRTDPTLTQKLLEILSYPDGTAGALMAKEYLAVPVDLTIGQATEHLRSLLQQKKGKISYIFVVDKNNRLLGVIQVRDLISFPHNTPVRDILKSPVVQVETGMKQMDVAKLLQRHRYLGLPVVDEAQKLVGVISADNALEVLEEEASDDIAKIIGTSAEEMRTSSVRKILRLRLPWLFFNIISGLICAYIAGLFHNNMQTLAILFLFVPVVLGLSESTGVQGATIVVRRIVLGDINDKEMAALFLRESLAGFYIGLICATIVGFSASLWHANQLLGLALVVSMATTIILSAFIGLILPLLFRKLKIDPAIAAGPLVLAICDIQTLILYFNISSWILRI